MLFVHEAGDMWCVFWSCSSERAVGRLVGWSASQKDTSPYAATKTTKQAGDLRSFGTVGAKSGGRAGSNVYGAYDEEEEDDGGNVRVRKSVVCVCVCGGCGVGRSRSFFLSLSSRCCCFYSSRSPSDLNPHNIFRRISTYAYTLGQFGYYGGGGFPGMRGAEHVQCSQQ